MIRTDREYEEALRRLAEARAFAEAQRNSLEATGLPPDHLDLAMSPILAMQDQMAGEVRWYEEARRGDIRPVLHFSDIGLTLIALRIAHGLTQRQLAERLGVSEAQVSKDERHQYHGISIERAQRVLEALNGSVTVSVMSRSDQERTPVRVEAN